MDKLCAQLCGADEADGDADSGPQQDVLLIGLPVGACMRMCSPTRVWWAAGTSWHKLHTQQQAVALLHSIVLSKVLRSASYTARRMSVR